ncbi:hypothetical protein EFY79_00185 [Hanamia caeni]|uniref:Uncharacterized protein n=1 Tax=Hanamia caeni TaxID=2294116 RepID=A0A3M9NPN6_9BACT|nr:hypothetical protein EFY79_00185 [Hanamia caeni]
MECKRISLKKISSPTILKKSPFSGSFKIPSFMGLSQSLICRTFAIVKKIFAENFHQINYKL